MWYLSNNIRRAFMDVQQNGNVHLFEKNNNRAKRIVL